MMHRAGCNRRTEDMMTKKVTGRKSTKRAGNLKPKPGREVGVKGGLSNSIAKKDNDTKGGTIANF